MSSNEDRSSKTPPATVPSADSSHAADATAPLPVESGICYVLFAYDVGFAIDLEEADRRVTAAAAKQRAKLRGRRRAPEYFEFDHPPLRATLEAPPIKLGTHESRPLVDALVYDFGAISVSFTIPLGGPLTDLRGLSHEIYDDPQLLKASRQIVDSLSATLGPAVSRPSVSTLIEDYAIFHIAPPGGAADLRGAVMDQAPLVAQILRAEKAALSRQEIDDALGCCISYTDDDLLVIDWNAALLIGEDAEDVRAVLEYTNVELLELRFLDDQLDRDLDEAYETMNRPRGLMSAFLGSRAGDLRRIAALQMDAALLHEEVNNALKLLGDQYLARVYRLASLRLHLTEWDASIVRKLDILEGLYTRISDHQTNQRMEVLEWIIIILIAISILLPFVPGVPGY